MGQVKRYECDCGYERQVCAGVGLAGENISIIEKCIPRNLTEKFKEELSAGNIERFLLSNALISCGKCKKLHTVSAFDFTLRDGAKISYTAPCPKCGAKCERVDDKSGVLCPKCGKVMACRIEGHWD